MEYRKNRVLRNTLAGILIVLIFVLAFFTTVNLFFNFFYTQTNVRGYSMLPTINQNVKNDNSEGDTIYINPRAEIQVDDIVVAKPKWENFTSFIIKRLVGLPGDTIEIKDLETSFGLFVNNKLLYTKEKNGFVDEYRKEGTIGYYAIYQEFLNNKDFAKYTEINEEGRKVIKLEENEFFLMGDNWGHTLDSLSKGPLTKQEITGKVELIIDIEDNVLLESIKHFMKKIFSV